MSTNFLEKIQDNEKKRQELISELISMRKMVKGSFCQIHVKCGKRNCWCATDQGGHPHWRMSLKINGKAFSRAVPPEEYEWIREMKANHLKFKSLRKEIVKLEMQTKHLLDQYEFSCTNESKKGKNYLEVENVISEAKNKKASGIPEEADIQF